MNDFFEPNGNRDILDAPKSDVDISQLISWSQSVSIAIEPEIKHLQHQTKIHQESPFPANKNINDKLYLWNGDITNLKVQAIVNSTNEALNDRNELSCKIIRIGGLQLKEELDRLKGCRTGDAKVTKGYLLPARYVIHTVGPKFNTKYQTAAESALHSCYYRTFALVKEFKIRTVALPAINSVRRSYPSHEGAHIALRTIRRFLEKNHEEVEAVVLVLEPVDFGIYELLLPLYFPRNIHEEEYALYYLPSSIGGPNGEPIIPERNIRISDKPLILPKSLSNPDKDDSFEESTDLASQLDSSIAVGQTSFARMHGDVDKKRKEAKRQQNMGIKVESDALTLEVQRKNKYERLLRKARTEDLRSIAAMRFLYTSGEDRMGHPIVIFVGFRCSFTNLDIEKAIMYLVHTMDPIVQREYSIVYFHTLTTPENHPSMQFLQQIYSILDYKYKKNLRNFYIVHPTFWTRVLSWWFTTFTTSGLKNKVSSLGGVEYLYSAIAPDQLELPPEVMDYDMKVNGVRYCQAARIPNAVSNVPNF